MQITICRICPWQPRRRGESLQRLSVSASPLDAFPVDAGQCDVALHAEIGGGDRRIPSHLGIGAVSHPDLIGTRQ
jgi:hypothetical protein